MTTDATNCTHQQDVGEKVSVFALNKSKDFPKFMLTVCL